MSDDAVIVIGAGAAGIAAARELTARGIECLVLEAGARVGGRAFTDLAIGSPFDHGASWLHDAEENPLAVQAQRLKLTTHESPRKRKDGIHLAGRRATPAERLAYQGAIEEIERAFEARAAQPGPDVDCGSVAAGLGGAWGATARHWLGTIINGAPLSAISVKDYVAIDLHGANWHVKEGLGTLVAKLAEGLPVQANWPVALVEWGGAGLAVSGPRGRLRCRGIVVTISTGVLQAEGIAFSPGLPGVLRDAIQGLPQGLLSKVVLRAAGADRLDLPSFARLERQVEGAGDSPMTFLLWPWARDHVIGFFGGERAWELAKQGPEATEAFAREELARYVGARRVQKAFRPGAVVTRWGQDPLFRGAYTIARPGAAGARQALREADLAGGRLLFAGEACHARHAATLGGAWDSGAEAGRRLAATLGARGR